MTELWDLLRRVIAFERVLRCYGGTVRGARHRLLLSDGSTAKEVLKQRRMPSLLL